MMRTTPKRFVKTFVALTIFGFVVMNMSLFMTSERDPSSSVFVMQQPGGAAVLSSSSSSHRPNVAQSTVAVHALNASHIASNKSALHGSASRYVHIGSNVTAIKAYIAWVNSHQPIYNLDRFDLRSSDNTIVIVVQVHSRIDYLRYLIDSLRKARFIEQALLVFSHDYFDDDINELIASIDFCLTMQIFYPHSIQLYPNVFPGTDPADCARDTNRAQALKSQCLNAPYPDKYGHYREAKYSQTKHHWFWKINFVFDRMEVTRPFNGPVLLLEEDHYVTEDFIYILLKMYRMKHNECKDCSIFTIGLYVKKLTYGAESSQVETVFWQSTKHNMGMSFNRDVWKLIRNCSKSFCEFDDYNWDWSLQYITMTCMSQRLKVMTVKSPRVHHIGECGIHHKGKNCDPAVKVRQIEDLLKASVGNLFPAQLTVTGNRSAPKRLPKQNGGWGDIRDHKLCLSFASAPPR